MGLHVPEHSCKRRPLVDALAPFHYVWDVLSIFGKALRVKVTRHCSYEFPQFFQALVYSSTLGFGIKHYAHVMENSLGVLKNGCVQHEAKAKHSKLDQAFVVTFASQGLAKCFHDMRTTNVHNSEISRDFTTCHHLESSVEIHIDIFFVEG